MKRFYEWLKNEGVTFSVAQAPQEQNLHNLVWDLAYDVAKKFPQEFRGKQIPEIITLDGDYYASPDPFGGTINFYSTGNSRADPNDNGFDEETTQKILKAIRYLAPEHNMKVIGEPVKNISNITKKPIYRIMVGIKDDVDAPPSLNLNSGNARELLNMLNIHPDNMNNYQIDVRELLLKLNSVTDFSKQMSTRAPEVSGRVFTGGLTEEMIERYVEVLEKMVHWAIKNNYDTINLS